MCYSFWFTLGVFFANVALNSLNDSHPLDWLVPIYIQWAQVGIMILIYVFLPESPPWCVERGDLDRARKALRQLNYGVKNYNLEQQLQGLILAAEHEKVVAIEQKREHWHAIFRGTDGLRTIIALWTNLSQQFIGLTLFTNFGTYFFQQAGLDDPFLVTVITSSINIAATIIIIFSVDRIGRRLIACCATTLAWASCVVIGILGVVPSVKATNYVFILFACLWSKLFVSVCSTVATS